MLTQDERPLATVMNREGILPIDDDAVMGSFESLARMICSGLKCAGGRGRYASVSKGNSGNVLSETMTILA